MKRWIILLFLFPLLVSGGQSLRNPTTTRAINVSDNVPDSASVRVEFHLHDITGPSSSGDFLRLDFFDFRIGWLSINSITVTFLRTVGTTPAPTCSLPMSGRNAALIRAQANLSSGKLQCEVWNADGSGYVYREADLIEGGTASSVTSGNISAFPTGSYRMGFLRGSTTMVPVGSRPPVTSDSADYFDLRFEGNGNDSSGSGRSVDVSGQTFSATPGLQAYGRPRTVGAKLWMPFKPLRAGHSNSLDGTSSFSMSDSTGSVSCYWQQVSGPSKLLWTGRNTCSPSISGAVFGTYILRLRASDANSSSTADLEVGAVAYDDNGVVIYPDERLYDLLGPVVVLGANPWEFAEYTEVETSKNNWNNYTVNGGNWNAGHYEEVLNGLNRTGTVHRPAPVTEPTKLYGENTNWMTQFCGGRVGPAFEPGLAGILVQRDLPLPAGQQRYTNMKVQSCQSETEVTIESNPTVISTPRKWRTLWMDDFQIATVTGTVYIDPAADPRKVYGVGTNLATEFCNGGTTKEIGNMRIVIFGGGETHTVAVASCQSQTEITLSADYTGAAIASPGVPWAYRHARTGPTWVATANDYRNFYDVALSYWRMWYRTGWPIARRSAVWLTAAANSSVRYAGADRATNPYSAAVLYGIEHEDQENEAGYWDDIRNYAVPGLDIPGVVGEEKVILDPREQAYGAQLRYVASMFAPEENRAAHRTQLENFWTRSLQYAQRADGFMHNANFWFDGHGGLSSETIARIYTLANGSTTATVHSGSNIPADLCGNPATFYSAGTISVLASGSTIATGSGTDWTGQASKQILLRGTLNGQPWSQYNYVNSVQSGTQLTLAKPWHGDSNSIVAYRIQASVNTGHVFGVWQTNSAGKTHGIEANYRIFEDDWYWCTVDSTTQLTLDKPYTGDTSGGNIYRRLIRSVPGSMTVNYMNGLLTQAIFQAAKTPGMNSTIATNYRNMALGMASHMRTQDDPFPPGAIGWWDNGTPFCRPVDRVPNACDDSPFRAIAATDYKRAVATEGMWGLATDYLTQPTPEKLAEYDAWYNGLYSKTGYDQPYETDNQPNAMSYLWIGGSFALRVKAVGQQFGMGGAQVWPAARVGGQGVPVPRTVLVPFSFEGVPSATSLRVVTYFPSGKVESKVCTSSPCTITLDARQGGHWILKQYLGADSQLIVEEARQFIQE